MQKTTAGLATAVALGAILGACSASPHTSTDSSHGSGSTSTTTSAGATSTTGSPATTSATTVTTETSSTTTTIAPASTTTTTLPDDYCEVPDLHARASGTIGAAGTIEVTFTITDISPSQCVFWGYPGALLLSSGGAPLETTVVRGGDLSFLNIAVKTVSIPSGGSAYFNLGYTDVPTGGETSCPKAASLEITPPNDTQQLVVQVAIDACDSGKLSVSPVFGANSPATSTTAPPG